MHGRGILRISAEKNGGTIFLELSWVGLNWVQTKFVLFDFYRVGSGTKVLSPLWGHG